MVQTSQIEELEAAPEELTALRAVFARHAGAPEDWPASYQPVRALVERSLARGAHDKAGLLLVAALEDLRRYFVIEDDDDDSGWHRSERKRWETWACARALRAVLMDGDRGPRRRELLAAIAALWTEAPEEASGWLGTSDLAPLGPEDLAALGEEAAEPTGTRWIAPEEALAEALLNARRLESATLGKLVDERIEHRSLDPAEDVADVVELLRRVAERLWARRPDATALAAAVYAALEGVDRASRAAKDDDVPVSSERDDVIDEQVSAIYRVLELAVVAGGPELRRRAREAAAATGVVSSRLAQVLGGSNEEEVAEDIARLRAHRDAAHDDTERFDIEIELVCRFGDHLGDEEFLALCRSRGFVEQEVDRLLRRGRADEALASAERTRDEASGSSHKLKPLGEAFLAAGRPEMAERLLRPALRKDPFVAEVFVRALLAQGSAEAPDACLAWFAQRPTLDTYQAIRRAIPGAAWPALQRRIREHLEAKRLRVTLVDLAVHDEDVAQLEALLPTLTGVEIEHARRRALPLLARLSREAANVLELAHSKTKKKTKARAGPKATGGSDAPAPTRVTHPKFGAGRVLRSEGSGDQRKYVIEFEGYGHKTLLARFVSPA